MLKAKVRPPFYVVPTLIFLGAGFALANGLGYGSGNLRQYLLHGLHQIDPSFLAHDWFTTHTQSHHSAFDLLVVFLARLSSLNIAFACLNALFAMIFILCIYFLAGRYYHSPLLVTAFSALLVILIPRPYIGWTAIINNYFQPSTIGAVGLLAGLTCLCFERYKTAGAIFLIAGVFHINYMVWSVLLVGSVVAINLNHIGVRRALYLIVPISLSVLYHLPFIAASRSPEQTANAALAATVLHDIYMPFHSRPLTWGIQPFIRFALLLSAGGIAVWVVRPVVRPNRITLTLLAAFGAIILLGIVFTTAIPIDTIALIFPYRLAPFVILAAQIAVAAAIVFPAQYGSLSPIKTLLLWTTLGGLLYACGVNVYGLSCLGAAAAALWAGQLASNPDRQWKTNVSILALMSVAVYVGGAGKSGIALVAALAVAGLVWRMAQRRAAGFSPRGDSSTETPHHRARSTAWPIALPVGKVLLPMCIAAFLMRQGAVRKDLLGPPPPADQQVLYAWCRTRTARSDVFIIPPDLAGFRLGARRAVVVDWKCMPILPKATVQWYHRLQAICGGDFHSLDQAVSGFDQIGKHRAHQLARRFGARYLVTRRENVRSGRVGSAHHSLPGRGILPVGRAHPTGLNQLRCAYADETFTVFDLEQD